MEGNFKIDSRQISCDDVDWSDLIEDSHIEGFCEEIIIKKLIY